MSVSDINKFIITFTSFDAPNTVIRGLRNEALILNSFLDLLLSSSSQVVSDHFHGLLNIFNSFPFKAKDRRKCRMIFMVICSF